MVIHTDARTNERYMNGLKGRIETSDDSGREKSANDRGSSTISGKLWGRDVYISTGDAAYNNY